MPRKNRGLTAEGQRRPQKVDVFKNGSIDLEELRKRGKGKACLRIGTNTVIPVSPENRNEEYATRFRNRIEGLR